MRSTLIIIPIHFSIQLCHPFHLASFSNPTSDKNAFQGSRTCLAINPHPKPSPCGKSMLIPPNFSYKTPVMYRGKKDTETNKMELTYSCGMLYIICTKQMSKVFQMKTTDMFLEHFVESSNKNIRNSLLYYFPLAYLLYL